jgi:hypothetical protein
MANVGDQVILESPFWHEGVDLGDRLGLVIDTQSYILVKVYQYHNNPVKCFQHDVRIVSEANKEEQEMSQELDGLFFNLI